MGKSLAFAASHDFSNRNEYRFETCEEAEIPEIIYREMTAGNDIKYWIREAIDWYYFRMEE